MERATDSRIERVERSVLEVYDYCPPTITHYSTEGREQYSKQWEWFMSQLGLSRADFRDKRLLDVGCGSCEKAVFYHDWGARVTGIEMTPTVIERARKVIGGRSIEIIPGSLFTARLDGLFDIVIADGMLHHTGDTFFALTKCVEYLREGGIVIIGLVNVWGGFWWFGLARAIVRLLGGNDFHRRARWGRRLFAWTRGSHEGTEESKAAYYRSLESWSYDWFANPRWNLHSPTEIFDRLAGMSLEHVSSQPPLTEKAPPKNLVARAIRLIAGNRRSLMSAYWLSNREPNMLYVCARKSSGASAVHHKRID